ncbi:ABC transporter [Kroppenstedtia guangzhouensis]|uniref:ABC transporter n=1 Tax=Kroppenstedtia guangzhouensis TaxID=1274356 RepID=A0ABQ1G5L6_9BACL|nr:ABC transporter ATP-binding protein [Kroppenstedtia guangzhouensis]GGA37200.1 ABC transporter [Kroppenstedtia guangzhouensis]
MRKQKVLEMESVTKAYGDHVVVNNLSVTLFEGEVFGLLGPNGSGKTTTIKSMTGLLTPDAGIITIDGLDVAAHAMKIKHMIGVMPDVDELMEDLTAWEFLRFIAAIRQLPTTNTDKQIEEWLRLLGIWEDRKRLLHSFSHGMRKKVQLVATLLHQPRLIILDEPTTGLDPEMIYLLKQVLREIKQKQIAVLLSTHDLFFAQQVCDRVCLIQNGMELIQGEVKWVLKQCQATSLEESYIQLTQSQDKRGQIHAILDHW